MKRSLCLPSRPRGSPSAPSRSWPTNPAFRRPSTHWPARITWSRLTNEIETRANAYLEKIEALGGMIKALERGYVQQEIQNAAYEYQQQVDHQQAVVVGVNRFTVEDEKPIPIQRIDEALERKQVERLRALRSRRDAGSMAS